MQYSNIACLLLCQWLQMARELWWCHSPPVCNIILKLISSIVNPFEISAASFTNIERSYIAVIELERNNIEAAEYDI